MPRSTTAVHGALNAADLGSNPSVAIAGGARGAIVFLRYAPASDTDSRGSYPSNKIHSLRCGASGETVGPRDEGEITVTRYDTLARYRRMITAAKELLGGACSGCPATDDLHFHHSDPSTKKFTIARGPGRKDFWDEVRKCVLLCRTCHKKLHAPEHGTQSRYSSGCRCLSCKEAHSIDCKRYRQRWAAARVGE